MLDLVSADMCMAARRLVAAAVYRSGGSKKLARNWLRASASASAEHLGIVVLEELVGLRVGEPKADDLHLR